MEGDDALISQSVSYPTDFRSQAGCPDTHKSAADTTSGLVDFCWEPLKQFSLTKFLALTFTGAYDFIFQKLRADLIPTVFKLYKRLQPQCANLTDLSVMV